MMDPIVAPFVERVKSITLHAPQIPYISNVTGTWITAAEATDPEYWGRHLRQAVRFSDGVRELLKEPNRVLLEVGPGTTLTTLARQQGTNGHVPTVVSSLRHPNQKHADEVVILQTLAQLFLAGVEIDWNALHNGKQRRRVQLPTYPFERARYWVEPAATEDDASAPDERRALDDWFYVPDWKRTVLVVDGDSDNSARQNGRLLILADTCGLAADVSKDLSADGHELITVSQGEDFASMDQHTYTINAGRPEDYTKLFAVLSERALLPDQVVHLWGVTASDEQSSFEESQQRGFYSLLWLARAAASNCDALDIAVVTNDMQAVSAGETLKADKATVLGGCKVIPQEYSNIMCRSIDVVLPRAEATRRRTSVTEQLIAEIQNGGREPVVAYRGPYRLVQSYQRVNIPPSNAGRGLRQGGVYLITGGMGGIGYTLARFLAESVHAKLILLSRNALPDSHPGEETHNQEVRGRRTAQVKTLEELGAEVMVINADVADEAQLRDAIHRATIRFGKIHGVIQAAGVAGGGVIQSKTEEEVARVWAPKVKGALLLAAEFKDAELDFLIFCSSVKSMLAEFGQSDYCAASVFLDTFAHALRCDGAVAATSINWDTWRDVGMAVDSQSDGVLGMLQEQTLHLGISPSEGVQAFERVLVSKLPQVIVSVRDLESRMVNRNASGSLLEQLGDAVQMSPAYPRPQLSNPYVAPSNSVEQKIADVWQRMLGIQQIGVHDNLFDLGGDSLTAVQIATQLKKEFGTPLPVVKLFEGPTIASLAGILDPNTAVNPSFARRQERGARRREKRKVKAAGQV